MKRSLILFLTALLLELSLTCCVISRKAPDAPEYIMIGQNEYRTGFYGDLYPKVSLLKDETFEVEGVTFYRANSPTYDWVHAYIGSKSDGTVYCLSSQWESAKAYYTNDEIFTYYCNVDRSYETVLNLDPEQFQALMDFSEKNRYDPFDPGKKVNKTVFDSSYGKISPGYIFYKKSNDGNFVSFKGDNFYVIDGALYLLYYFDGKDDTMQAVEVPKTLSDYFISKIDEIELNNTGN